MFVSRLSRLISGNAFLNAQFDITNACNLNCSHCYHSNHKNTGALTLKEWKAIVDQYHNLANKLHLRPKLALCGGEPLTSPFLVSLIDYIDETVGSHCEISILTNGTLLTDKLLKLVENKNIAFQVSLDGPSPDTHDVKRGHGSFRKAMSGIEKAKNYGFPVSIQSILSSVTSQQIEEFFQLAKRTGAEEMNFVRFVSEGQGQNLTVSGIDSPLYGIHLKEAFEKIIKFSRKYRVYSAKNQALFHLIDPSLGANEKCGFGFTVGYQGALKVSSRIPVSVGNLREDSLEDLFLGSEQFTALRAGTIEVCGSCRYFARCGGSRNASYAAFGNVLGPDPGCWIPEIFNLDKETKPPFRRDKHAHSL